MPELSAALLQSLQDYQWLLKLGWGWRYVRSNTKIAVSNNLYPIDWMLDGLAIAFVVTKEVKGKENGFSASAKAMARPFTYRAIA